MLRLTNMCSKTSASCFTSITEESIPKKSSNTKYNKSWSNDDCKNAIRSRKTTRRKFNLQPSADNLNNFKTHRAKTRRVNKKLKKTFWRHYVNKLQSSSESKRVWDMYGPIKHVSKNHIKATNEKDIADLVKTFSKNYSTTNYSKPFQNITKMQKRPNSNLIQITSKITVSHSLSNHINKWVQS